MSEGPQGPIRAALRHELDALRGNWLWFVILGVMIWQEWPASSFWVIGLFLGINLVFRGFTWIGLGLALRTLPCPATGRSGSLSEPYASANLYIRSAIP